MTVDGHAPDAVLAEAIRHGEVDAFGYLWTRHVSAARGAARTLTKPDKVDDLVSEAFARILRLLRAGRGPTENFRSYLFATLRTVNVDLARPYASRVFASGLNSDLEPSLPAVVDPDGFDGSVALRAWASLNENDRTILWSSIVEGASVEETAIAAAVDDKVVAVRAFRARERLREAFLREHILAATDATCRKQRHRLAAFARGTLADSKRGHLENHLRSCDSCQLAATEVMEVNRSLKVVIGPIITAAGGWATARHLHGITSGGTAVTHTGPLAAFRLHRIHHLVHAARRVVPQHRFLVATGGAATACVATIAITIGVSAGHAKAGPNVPLPGGVSRSSQAVRTPAVTTPAPPPKPSSHAARTTARPASSSLPSATATVTSPRSANNKPAVQQSPTSATSTPQSKPSQSRNLCTINNGVKKCI